MNQEVKSMTMLKRDPNNIWRQVREDRDVDDLIFRDEYAYFGHEDTKACSER